MEDRQASVESHRISVAAVGGAQHDKVMQMAGRMVDSILANVLPNLERY